MAAVIDGLDEGRAFEPTFERYFGASLHDIKRAFVNFVEATEHRPDQRLDGTLWKS
jgi:hypothetical protein